MTKTIPLAQEELRARAQRIRLVITDCDGVLTDNGVYYSERGEELKRYSHRDGHGVERLRTCGIETAFLTKEKSEFSRRRAEKLKLTHVYVGVQNKLEHLAIILRDSGLSTENLAFIADDMNDLPLLTAIGEVGLTAAPLDAVAEVIDCVEYHCTTAGGHGAFREFAERIIAHRTSAPSTRSPK